MPKEEFIPPHLLGNESNELRAVLHKEGDLPCVLLSVSLLEKAVRSLLQTFLIEVPESEEVFWYPTGPLADFSARIKMAYCIGMIDEGLFKNLDYVRKIRNEFAHSHRPLTFDDQRVKAFCMNLNYPMVLWRGEDTPDDWLTRRYVEMPWLTARDRFEDIVINLIEVVKNAAVYLEPNNPPAVQFVIHGIKFDPEPPQPEATKE